MEKAASVIGFPLLKRKKKKNKLERKYGYIKMSSEKNREDVKFSVHNSVGIAFTTLNIYLRYFEPCLFKIF